MGWAEVSLLARVSMAAALAVPSVTLQYAEPFDRVCANRTDYEIKAAWRSELAGSLPRWRKLWETEGRPLLVAAARITGRPFPDRESTVSLSLCTFPSMSAPLLVNARHALHAFTEKPVSDAVLMGTVVHEILHGYLDGFVAADSPVLSKYASEPAGVRGHLHLFALLKASYLKHGWRTKLDEVVAKDQSLPNGDYRRAWAIINGADGHGRFLDELRGEKRPN